MRVTVEWLDGVVRTYENVGEKQLTRDSNLLTLWGHRAYGGLVEHVASIPLGQVRAYQVRS